MIRSWLVISERITDVPIINTPVRAILVATTVATTSGTTATAAKIIDTITVATIVMLTATQAFTEKR
jgi:hypothetical protein